MTCASTASVQNYYELLQLSQSATTDEVKQAYRRALLMSHPDKKPQTNLASASKSPVHLLTPNPSQANFDISVLQEAVRVLSSPILRSEYDQSLLASTLTSARSASGPRPAQVVSLEDFDEVEEGSWTYNCRCGGSYGINDKDLEADRHLVVCGSCSEVIYVGYEIVEEAEGQES